MQSMQSLGMIDSKEDRVQMSAVLSLSNVSGRVNGPGRHAGIQNFNVIDLLSLQKALEIELMRKALNPGKYFTIFYYFMSDHIYYSALVKNDRTKGC